MYGFMKSKFNPLGLVVLLALASVPAHALPPLYDGGIPVLTFNEEDTGSYRVADHFTDVGGPDAQIVYTYSAPTPAGIATVGPQDFNGRRIRWEGLLNQFGSFSVQAQATNSVGQSTVVTINFVVNPIEEPPILIAPLLDGSGPEDFAGPVLIDLTTHFEEPDGQPLTYRFTGQSDPDAIDLQFLGSTLVVNPVPNGFGNNFYGICAVDSQNNEVCDTAVFSIAPVDDVPVVLSELGTLTIDEDEPNIPSYDLATIFEDVDNALTYSVAVVPVGLIDASVVGEDLQLTAAANQFGSGTVEVTATGGGISVSSTLSLTVTSVLDPPEVISPLGTMEIFEDQQGIPSLNLDDHFTDMDGEALNYTFTAAPADLVNITLSGSSLSFDTIANVTGTVLVTVTANNAAGDTISDTLTIDITPIPDPPVRIAFPPPVVFDEDQPGALPTVDLSTLYFDPDTPDLIYTIVNNLPAGRVTASISGSILSFGTILDQNGAATVEITVSDGNQTASLNTIVNVDVVPTNDAPRNDVPLPNIIVDEDTAAPTSTNLSTAFTDPDGDALSYSLVSVSPTGVIDVAVVGSQVEYSTILNQFGAATVTVQATDGNPADPAAIFVQDSYTVTVAPTPDAPTVVDPIDDQVIDEDSGAITFDLATVFEDVDQEPLTYRVVSNSNAAVVDAVVGGNTLTITPVEDQSAAGITIVLEARDPSQGQLNVDTQFNIDVLPINDAPEIIVPLPRELAEDTPDQQTEDGTQWFTDADLPFGDTLTYSGSENAGGDPVFVPGSVSVDSNGTVRYEILINESGFASIDVTAEDQAGETATVTFTVIVNPTNDPPVEDNPLPPQQRDEDANPQAEISLVGVFRDDDIGFTGDTLEFSAVVADTSITNVTVFGDTLRLDPVEHAFGSTTVTVTATDIEGESATSTFELEIVPTNDEPFVNAVQPPLFQIDEDSPETLVPLFAYFDDVDLSREGDSFTYEIVSGATTPLFSSIVENTGGVDGILITPAPDAIGFHTVMVRAVDDGGLRSPPAPLNIEILPVFVIAADDAVSTDEGIPLNQPASGDPANPEPYEEIDVLANDVLGDPPTTIISAGADIDLGVDGFFPSATQSPPTNSTTALGIGQLAPNGRVEIVGNRIHYFPKEGFSGVDFFEYVIQDGDGDTSTATVTVTVSNVNTPPQATVSPTYDIFQGDTLVVLAEGGLADSGFDPDGDTLTVTYDNIPPATVAPTFDRDADGSFTLTPDPSFVGTISFTIQLHDLGTIASEVIDVTINVGGTPPPPTLPPAGEVEFDMNLSDVPLEDAISTEANVLVVMDDSGSMDWDMMTDQSSGVFRVTNVGRQNGITGRGRWFYYIYDLPTNVFGGNTGRAAPVQETIDALSGPGEDLQGNEFGVWRLRSSQYSTIYYNPEIEYTPWRGLDRNNTDFGNAPPTAAPLDPFDVNGQTIDLTGTYNFTSTNVPVFRNFSSGLRNYVNTGVYLPYYYTTPVAGRPAWNAQRTKITIDDVNATYPGGLSRLDCAESDGNPLSCSFDEELQNFANWFTYYRTREYTAKAALGRALADTANLRMGYAVLNDSNDREPIDSLNSSFRTGHKAELLAQIYSTNSGGGTPLRRALDRAGRHFECRANDSFGSSTSSVPGSPACPILPQPEGQCQNNFTLLFSDGTWNGNATGVPNADAASDTAFDGGVFADGNTGTLADIAMHYYERDLHSTLPDGVPTSGRDIALAPEGSFQDEDELMHQHMKTYTVGFGVSGDVDFGDLPIVGVDPDSGEPVIDFTQSFNWPNALLNSSTAKTDDMLHAALNGRGDFLQANNPVALAQAFQAAFDDFSDGSVSVSAVAFGSTRLREGTVEYRGFFNLKFNSGDLEAIELLDAVTGVPPQNPLVWSAATQMELIDPNNRVIFTYDRIAQDGRPFRYASLNADQQNILSLLEVDYLRGDQALEEPAGPFRARDSVLGDIVNSAPRTVGRPQGIRRDRAPFPTDVLYSSFRESLENRRRVVYVGANDGMLHAFDAGFEDQTPIENGTGNELFAFVPNKIIDGSQRFNNDLDQFASVVYSHRFFVDLTPAVEDVFVRPNGTGIQSWRTVLVGGLRGGGKGYYALDITNPDAIASNEINGARSVLWEFTDADDTYPTELSGGPLGGSFGAVTDLAGQPVTDLGYTYSEPRIVMTNVDGASPNRKKWAAIFGNGYNSTAGIAKLFVLFIDDGVDGWQNGDFVKINTGAGVIATNPSDPANQDPMAGIPNGLGQPTAIDTNLDGVVDTVYAGDLQGNLYRFEVGDENPNNWQAVKLFTATANGNTQTRQPITTAPTVTKVPNQEGFIITVGTGSFITEEDGLSTDIQSVYGIWDRFEPAPRTAEPGTKLTLLTEQVITNVVDENRVSDTLRIMSNNAVNLLPGNGIDANYGWYIDLDPVRASTTLQGNSNTDSGGLAPPNPQYPGERAIRRIVQRGNSLVLTTVIPRDANSCFRAPPGALWFVDALTGGNPSSAVIDLDNDGIVDANDLITVDGEEFVAGILFDAGSGDGSLVDPSVLLGDSQSDFLIINLSHDEDPRIFRTAKDANSKTGRLSWWEILGE